MKRKGSQRDSTLIESMIRWRRQVIPKNARCASRTNWRGVVWTAVVAAWTYAAYVWVVATITYVTASNAFLRHHRPVTRLCRTGWKHFERCATREILVISSTSPKNSTFIWHSAPFANLVRGHCGWITMGALNCVKWKRQKKQMRHQLGADHRSGFCSTMKRDVPSRIQNSRNLKLG